MAKVAGKGAQGAAAPAPDSGRAAPGIVGAAGHEEADGLRAVAGRVSDQDQLLSVADTPHAAVVAAGPRAEQVQRDLITPRLEAVEMAVADEAPAWPEGRRLLAMERESVREVAKVTLCAILKTELRAGQHPSPESVEKFVVDEAKSRGLQSIGVPLSRRLRMDLRNLSDEIRSETSQDGAARVALTGLICDISLR